jgi:predicted nucleic-acid-binding Zn-ribbon protein
MDDLQKEQEAARAAQRDKYAATIHRLWVQPDDCPICGSNAWNTGELIQTQLRDMPTLQPLAAALMGQSAQVYVYVPVTCVICGYSIFFHSGVLDVRDEETVKAIPPVRRPESDAK